MNQQTQTRDDLIRAALREADRNGSLPAVAEEVGIAGGTEELRRLMESTGQLSIIDRGILGIHFGLGMQ